MTYTENFSTDDATRRIGIAFAIAEFRQLGWDLFERPDGLFEASRMDRDDREIFAIFTRDIGTEGNTTHLPSDLPDLFGTLVGPTADAYYIVLIKVDGDRLVEIIEVEIGKAARAMSEAPDAIGYTPSGKFRINHGPHQRETLLNYATIC